MKYIDTAKLEKRLLADSPELLETWLPGGYWGKGVGGASNEYKQADWSVSGSSGRWCNWSTKQHGDDLLSLYAILHTDSDAVQILLKHYSDAWEPVIRKYLADKQVVIMADVLTACGVEACHQIKKQQHRAAAIMRQSGWERGHRTTHSKHRQRIWISTVPTAPWSGSCLGV